MDEESVQSEAFVVPFLTIKKTFEARSCEMFNHLSNFKDSSSNQASAPYLAQLLTRIDYNNFFTNLRENHEREKMQQELIRAGKN
jgi:hypothetical protein